MKKKSTFICPSCGGTTKKGKTTFTAELGFGVVVVRGVEATICTQCGADWIEDSAAEKIQKIVNAANKQHPAVEVVSLSV